MIDIWNISKINCCLQELVQDETRSKLAAQSKLRQLNDEKEAMADRLEEEEENKRMLEKQVAELQQKVNVLNIM